MLRLGDGTAESNARLQSGIDELWMYTGELFETEEADTLLLNAGIAVDPQAIKTAWIKTVDEILAKAKIKKPLENFMQTGSKLGQHSEHLGHILAEMQYLPRTFPGVKW